MLRITTEQHADHCTLGLHGSLGGPWVPLLERHWRALVQESPSARMTVVLSDVAFIDADGERLLTAMAEAGVEFVVSGCMNRYVIDRLQERANHVSAE